MKKKTSIGSTLDRTAVTVRSGVAQSDMSLYDWIRYRAHGAKAVANSTQIKSNSLKKKNNPENLSLQLASY